MNIVPNDWILNGSQATSNPEPNDAGIPVVLWIEY